MKNFYLFSNVTMYCRVSALFITSSLYLNNGNLEEGLSARKGWGPLLRELIRLAESILLAGFALSAVQYFKKNRAGLAMLAGLVGCAGCDMPLSAVV